MTARSELIPYAIAGDRYLAHLARRIARRAYAEGDINRARFERWLTEIAPALPDDRRETVYRFLPAWLQGVVEDYEEAERAWQAERRGLIA
jgi:hypothetical protein